MSAPRRDCKVRLPRRNLAEAAIIPRLPDWRDSFERGNPFPPDLIGATIVAFGAAPPEFDLEGGGLIIDYVPQHEADPKRLVLAFNELGMWIER
jgi:hypothetical protein